MARANRASRQADLTLKQGAATTKDTLDRQAAIASAVTAPQASTLVITSGNLAVARHQLNGALTSKRRKFAEAVAAGMPASRAYVAAGYHAKNSRVAEVEGSRLLRNDQVAAYISSVREAASHRAGITIEGVFRELWSIGSDYEVAPGPRVLALRTLGELLSGANARLRLPRSNTPEPVSSADEVGAMALHLVRCMARGEIAPAEAKAALEVANMAAALVIIPDINRQIDELTAKRQEGQQVVVRSTSTESNKTRPTWFQEEGAAR